MRDLIQIESGNLQLKAQTLDFENLVFNTTLDLAQQQSEENRCTIKFSKAPAQYTKYFLMVRSDKSRLSQVLLRYLQSFALITEKNSREISIDFEPLRVRHAKTKKSSCLFKFEFVLTFSATKTMLLDGAKKKYEIKMDEALDTLTIDEISEQQLQLLISRQILKELGGDIQVDTLAG